MKQVASLQYGVIFKKAFSQPDIFTAFVKAVLGIQFSCDKVETEKSFRPSIGNVDSRFDLFAQDEKNRVIVDIQHRKKTVITTVFCIITVQPFWNKCHAVSKVIAHLWLFIRLWY